MATKLLAASPFINPGEGTQHKRVVLKADNYGTDHVEYIVHNQYVDETGRTSFGDGNYCLSSNAAGDEYEYSNGNALSEAWDIFNQRSSTFMKRVLAPDYPDQLSDLNSERFAKFKFNIKGKGD